MSMWTAIAVISFFGICFAAYEARLKAMSDAKGKTRDKEFDRLEDHVRSLEQRLANVETILLERQRDDKWERLRHE